MRNVIAAINMTLDGYCNHNYGIADNELHEHFTELLKGADTVVYGRITFQLMEYWKEVVENPTGNKANDEFAKTIDNVPEKVIFSNTLTHTDWKGTRIVNRDIKKEILKLKKQSGHDILVGSPSLIAACINLNLVDELQLSIHPVIAGKGLPLFKNIQEMQTLNLIKTETFKSGVITCYYKPV